MDNAKRPLNPDFILNKPRYRGATVLVARENFGCGSSREHAPWALLQYGFQTVIAPSFADIFYNNSLKNGLLLIKLEPKMLSTVAADMLSTIETQGWQSVFGPVAEETKAAPTRDQRREIIREAPSITVAAPRPWASGEDA